MFEFLAEAPLYYAKIGAVALFASLAALIWLLPRSYVYAEDAQITPLRNLRLWATLLLALQLILYWIF